MPSRNPELYYQSLRGGFGNYLRYNKSMLEKITATTLPMKWKEDPYKILFPLAVGISVLLYWSIGWLFGEPLSVVACYRYGDLAYYPIIRAMSDCQFGEVLILEYKGQGIQSFPWVTLLPHGFLFRVFGIWGWAIADVLIAVGYYLLLRRFLFEINIQSPLRDIAALLCSSPAKDLLVAKLRLLGFLIHLPQIGYRIPRPFITELILLACLTMLTRCFISGDKTVRSWGLLGLTFAALVQSNIYPAVTISILILVGCAYLWTKQIKLGEGILIFPVIVFLVVTVFTSFPFFFQRLFEHPDVLRRFGLFHVDRFGPLFFVWRKGYILKTVFWSGLVAFGISLSSLNEKEKKSRYAVILGSLVAVIAANLAMPLQIAALGKAIQPYHYRYMVLTFLGYAFLVYLLYTVELIQHARKVWSNVILEHTASRMKTPAAKAILLSVLVSLILVYLAKVHVNRMHWKKSHMRSDFSEYASLSFYRRDFTALITELGKKRYADCLVLGTFDHQLYSWWVTFKGGFSFLPDPFATTMPDAVIEERLSRLCQILDMSHSDFEDFITRRYVNIFFLGSNKYQASTAYTFHPLVAYSQDIRDKIKKTSVFDSWSVHIPETEIKRLLRVFENAKTRADFNDRLDLIVLTNDESLRDHFPDPETWNNAYENQTFRVFLRKALHRQP